MALERVVVLGLGKVGSLVATLLHESKFVVRGADAVERAGFPFPTHCVDVDDEQVLRACLTGSDAVVSCLPYHRNLPVARTAHSMGLHYFDLTEDVPTTQAVRTMASSARSLLAPQCGLAPGFIGIVGAHLARGFDRHRSIELRVGALPQNPRGKLGYSLTWSPEGVINEYINDAEVIRDGEHRVIPSMELLETIFVDGVELEAFATSGGLGTLCETFAGRVRDLNYKTMRYPGHAAHMRFLLDELRLREDRKLLGKIMENALPPVDDDRVLVHAAVEGWRGEQLARVEYVRAYEPMVLSGKRWRAISWTTAAGVCGVVELVREGKLPSQGFLKQEEIPFEDFLATPTGSLYLRGERTQRGHG